MSTTLVAVFDEYGLAQDAFRKLQEAGINSSSIQLNGAASQSHASDLTSGSHSLDSDDRPGAISRFFSDMFGMDDGNTGKKYLDAAQRGNTVLTVDVADEDRIEAISDILDDCGAIDVDEREQHLRGSVVDAPLVPGTHPSSGDMSTGAAHMNTALAGGAARAPDVGGDATLKVVQETMQVGARTVQKGNVRVHRRVVETPVEEQISLRDERAVIERTQVDRPATAAELESAFQDKEIEIQETTQEAVVSKSARVVEEVKVGKQAVDRTETVRETLKRSSVEVDGSSDDMGKSDRPLVGEDRHANDINKRAL